MAEKIKKMRNGLRVNKENGVTWSMFIITLFSVSLVLLMTLPNIYLDNQIYYESREIAHQQHVVKTLREEQTIIKRKLKAVKYQENVLNQELE
jgi:competence protein ComGC